MTTMTQTHNTGQQPIPAVVPPQVFTLWGKTDPADRSGLTGIRHPLLWHLLVTSAVAERLWETSVSAHFRRAFTEATGQPGERQAGAWFAVLAAMHDLGKATPHFQQQARPLGQVVHDGGLECLGKPWMSHEQLGASALKKLFISWGSDCEPAVAWATALSVEHGVFLRSFGSTQALVSPRHFPGWHSARMEVVDLVRQACGAHTPLAFSPRIASPLMMEVAGLVKSADWVASGPRWFPHLDEPMSVQDYMVRARENSARAERKTPLAAWKLRSQQPKSFTELFGQPPRPVQTVVGEVARAAPLLSLIVVEAPMGIGKTEAALWAAHEYARKGATGFYVALPTQATAREMHRRVSEWLRAVGSAEDVPILNTGDWNVPLPVTDEADSTPAANESDEACGDRYDAVPVGGHSDGHRPGRAQPTNPTERDFWFRGAHCSLLYPIGVGTSDQVTLSAQPVKYVQARLSGFAGRVIIFDEIHAFDVFQATLLKTTLQWLAALGCPVVLLSATLPIGMKTDFVNAYRSGLRGEQVMDPLPEAEYPAVTCATAHEVTVTHPIETREQTTVVVRHLPVDPHSSDSDITAALRQHITAAAPWGTVGVVCNSVAHARNTYRSVRAAMPEATALLLHSKFCRSDRAAIGQRVLRQSGKDSLEIRDKRLCIVVGTQIIEQSLDLDFDLLVTEFAPADLLLQRAGRVHRWANTPRPVWAADPAVWVLSPPVGTNGVPDFAPMSWVYRATVPTALLRTWDELKYRTQLRLPEDIPTLVQSVYDGTTGSLSGAELEEWETLNTRQTRADNASQGTAKTLTLPFPWLDTAWNSEALEDERYRTRDGDESMQVAVAHRTAGGLIPVSRRTVLPVNRNRGEWQQSTLNVRKRVFDGMVEDPPAWKGTALAHTKLLVLDPDGPLTYDAEFGLV